MHAECQFKVMTYISISKPAGHAGEASKILYEPVYIWITFLGLGIPFKDSSLIVPAEVSPMKSGPRLT